MAEQEAKDNVAKNRIITHMNADHHDSVIRYLEFYSKLPSWQAYDGKVSGIDLNGMTLVCRSKTYRIPFNPPMSSYREARERVVEMDKEALAGLGQSDITVKEFLPPTGLQVLIFGVICATFLGYSQRWWFTEGAVVEQYLGSGFAKFSWSIQPYLITFMLVVHSAETVYMMMYKLRKHAVNPRSSLFWKWTATTFIEGVQAFGRFNGLIQKKQEEKAKQKH
ncbi:hypothetical protein LTR85_006465 [Meristemomyces frigidus]|nr:hypothetical protein LTR85_006465 [Meristemomyces frigidus]